MLVPPDDPVKLVCLTVRNTGDRPRRLSATYYAEWVLGTVRENAPLQVVCERDRGGRCRPGPQRLGRQLRRAGRLRWPPARGRSSVTADRTEFLGRNGSPVRTRRPGARRPVRPRRPGARPVRGADDGDRAGPRRGGRKSSSSWARRTARNEVRRLVAAYTAAGRARRGAGRGAAAMGPRPERRSGEDARPGPGPDGEPLAALPGPGLPGLGAGRRSTSRAGPTASATSSRTSWPWSTAPRTRRGRRSCARRPGSSRKATCSTGGTRRPGVGVRTRITDDLFFLPLVVHHYVTATGDAALLDERVPFLKSPVLRPDQEEDFNLPAVSEQVGHASTSTASAPWSTATGSGRTACR